MQSVKVFRRYYVVKYLKVYQLISEYPVFSKKVDILKYCKIYIFLCINVLQIFRVWKIEKQVLI